MTNEYTYYEEADISLVSTSTAFTAGSEQLKDNEDVFPLIVVIWPVFQETLPENKPQVRALSESVSF